jgi:hypothetical protein
MKLVGKIVLLFFLALNMYASTAYLSKNSIVLGEKVVLVIQVNGKDIEFPDINSIEGFNITATGMQQSIEYINGSVTKKIEKHYEFLPTKSIDVPSFEVIVDGKKEPTQPLHVEVSKATVKNSNFLLEMKIKKSEVMQFEAVPMEVIFKRAANQDVRDLRFAPPKFDNFWVKEGKKTKPFQEGNFIVHKINFFLYPQKSGDFELNPAQVSVGVASKRRDMFNMLTNQLDWKNVFSNTLSLHVKPLVGTNLYGSFDIKASVDKIDIESNQGVNFTISIMGTGNFDDIEAYDLKIEQANIYADKPAIKTYINGDKMDGNFTQKFSISSNSDFTIPSMKLTYFDANLQKLTTKTTDPIAIHVNSTIKEKNVQVSSIVPNEKKIEKVEVLNYYYLVGAFLSGVILTIFILLIVYLLRRKEYKAPRFKSDRDLLKQMLKYRGKSIAIDEQILALEENLYASGKNKINKKVLDSFV